MRSTLHRLLLLTLLAPVASACGSAASTPDASPSPASPAPRIFQPGAPGEGARELGTSELADLDGIAPTEADVRFMQGMIHHHAQALQMVDLIAARSQDEGLRRLGLRIEISQKDEIGLMEGWLRARGEVAPDWQSHMGHRAGMMGGLEMMPGMLTPEQMRSLEAARGVEFERLFLELMIQHHDGALIMVRELFASPGAAQETQINQFAADVDADQTMEIRRMRAMLEARR